MHQFNDPDVRKLVKRLRRHFDVATGQLAELQADFESWEELDFDLAGIDHRLAVAIEALQMGRDRIADEIRNQLATTPEHERHNPC